MYYDCFEYLAEFQDWKTSLPTKRNVQLFGDTVNFEPQPRSYDSDGDDEEEKDDDPSLDEPVEFPSNGSERSRQMVHMQAIFGKFLNSRVFRIKLDLKNVTGMALRVEATALHPNDQLGVLILELNKPVDDFCV